MNKIVLDVKAVKAVKELVGGGSSFEEVVYPAGSTVTINKTKIIEVLEDKCPHILDHYFDTGNSGSASVIFGKDLNVNSYADVVLMSSGQNIFRIGDKGSGHIYNVDDSTLRGIINVIPDTFTLDRDLTIHPVAIAYDTEDKGNSNGKGIVPLTPTEFKEMFVLND